MTKSALTLTQALQQHIARTGDSIEMINEAVYCEPGREPLFGGKEYLRVIRDGIRGDTPLHDRHTDGGGPLLAAWLIKERIRLGLDDAPGRNDNVREEKPRLRTASVR